jgi:aminoglycoside phosphotransferase
MSIDTDSLTPATASAVLSNACSAAGLDATGAELVRIGSNAVYRLRGDVIARVSRSSADPNDVARQVRVARWLEDVGYPAARALDIEQPVLVTGRLVTFWVSVSDVEEYAELPEVARLLRELHALPIPSTFDLPPMNPLENLASKLDLADSLDMASAEFFREHVDSVRTRYEALTFPLTLGVIHGDANIGNVIKNRSNKPILIDLDNFATGHREWDLVQTALFYERFGWHTESEYRSFVSEYGYDIMEWPGYPVLADYRELSMTLWLCGKVGDTPDVMDEVKKRIQTIKNGGPRTNWAPF